MNALKFWTKAIIVDAIMATVFYLWLIRGVDGAGNLALFLVWTIAVLRILGSFALDKDDAKRLWRPAGFGPYHHLTELAVIVALAWSGNPVTASVFTLAYFLLEGARSKALKAADADPSADALPSNLLIFSGGPGSGKTTALELIRESNIDSGKRVFDINAHCTDAALRIVLRDESPDVVIFDESGPERDLRALAEEFPGVRFFAAQ